MADLLAGLPLTNGAWRRDGRWWVHPDGTRVPVIAGGTNIFALTQFAFRFYEDGTETGSVAIAAQSTNISRNVSADSTLQLRIGLNESGAGNVAGATTDDYQLQVSKNGLAYANVTAASSNVRGFDSASLTEGEAATQRLTGGVGTFSGKVSEDGLVDNLQIAGNGTGEVVYSLTIVAADIADADTLDFRVLLNGATTNVTYSVTPQITVSKPVPVVMAPGVAALLLVGALVGVGFQAPPTGDLTITGAAPTVSVGAGTETNIAVPAGALDFTGLVLEGLHFLGAETGALALTGQAPGLALGMPIPAGSVVAAGVESALQFGTALDVGTLTLAGTTSTLDTALTGAVGALVVDGQNPALVVGLPIDNGSLQLTGEAPALQLAFVQDLPAGALAVDGLAPDAVVSGGTNTDLPVPAGVVTLSGQASALTVDVRFDLQLGALTLTGLPPVLGVDIRHDLLVGTVTLDGLAPAPMFDARVDLPSGALTLIGAESNASIGEALPIPAGAVAVTGLAPVARESGAAVPDSGVLVLDGQIPSLGLGYALPAGSVTLTGAAADLLVGQRLPLPVGALTLTGLTPALTEILAIAPDAGVLALAGQTPNLAVAYQFELPAGSLTLTGTVLVRADGLPLSVGAASLAGLAPSLSYDVALIPDSGALVLTGTTTDLLAGAAQIDAGAITITGYPPIAGLMVTPDVIITVGPDMATIHVQADVDTITVRPEPQLVTA